MTTQDSPKNDPAGQHGQPVRAARRLFLLGLLLATLTIGGWATWSWRYRASSERTVPAPEAAGPSRGGSPIVQPTNRNPPGSTISANQPLREEALQLAERLAHEFPQSVDAIYVRGLLLNRYGENAEAVQCWQACLRLAPGFVSAYEQLGADALKRGQSAEAASFLRKALRLDPKQENASLRLAEALLNVNHVEEGISVLEKHVATWPSSVEGHYRLGQAYARQKAYFKAIKHYESAIQADPNCTPAHYGLATVYAELGDAKKASEFRERFQKLKQQDMVSQKSRRRDHDDAAMLRKALAAAYRTAGIVYAEHKNPQEAESCWRKSAGLDPEDTESRNKLAMALAQANRTEEARQFVEELRQIEPGNPAHWLSLGTLTTRLKQFDAAEAAFRKAIGLAPKRAEGRIGLAQLYVANRRNLPEAKALAQQAIELQPTAENYFVLSFIHLNLRDAPAARAAIQEAVARDPTNPKYREALGALQQKTK